MSHWIRATALALLTIASTLPAQAAGTAFPPPPGLTLTDAAPVHHLALQTAPKVHLPARFMRQVVAYDSDEAVGTIIVSTGDKYLYLILGGPMDSLSMILLTIPIFFPIIMSLDFGLTPEETALWFGILVLISVEVGLISPPVGMNLFIIQSMAKDVPTGQVFRGVIPFIISDVVRTVILVAFPSITLWLLRTLY